MSPEAHTEQVFQTILNFSDYENRKTPWYEQMNLLDIMKMAGYKTFWFSNQEKTSLWESNPSILASRADFSFWTPPQPSESYDEQLISLYQKHKSLLDTASNEKNNKNLIIFHLQGSHLEYKSRFPHSYAKFKPSDIDAKNLHTKYQKDLQIISDYVNSLYYTDDVLNQIFDLFKNTDSIIFYFSDHAQDVFQSDHSVGHRCSNYGVEIPFMIFVTDAFKMKHKKEVDLIKSALKKPFMTDDFIQSLLPLIGIKTQDNIESKNIFSSQFDIKRKRFYCGDNDYDKGKTIPY
ncbi:hypothetical protein BKH41_03470 [Helicobacter sp. 12S02232-10]|uniref:phosphoethanolamine transferase n=1 Tax=Helicobacter sp. 12S02232-10 TaxID=1476197 RepID=UPI000BA76F18|nr:phosphoethanolamine transferase [Helicobacter sp. 12S02232-10]PAF49154.1 hypothetical protein BKH41_03470 [Helicobacter sp. 12S02232-10]